MNYVFKAPPILNQLWPQPIQKASVILTETQPQMIANLSSSTSQLPPQTPNLGAEEDSEEGLPVAPSDLLLQNVNEVDDRLFDEEEGDLDLDFIRLAQEESDEEAAATEPSESRSYSTLEEIEGALRSFYSKLKQPASGVSNDDDNFSYPQNCST